MENEVLDELNSPHVHHQSADNIFCSHALLSAVSVKHVLATWPVQSSVSRLGIFCMLVRFLWLTQISYISDLVLECSHFVGIILYV